MVVAAVIVVIVVMTIYSRGVGSTGYDGVVIV